MPGIPQASMVSKGPSAPSDAAHLTALTDKLDSQVRSLLAVAHDISTALFGSEPSGIGKQGTGAPPNPGAITGTRDRIADTLTVAGDAFEKLMEIHKRVSQ